MPTLQEAWAATTGTIAERQAQLRALTEAVDAPIQAREIKKLWSRWMVLARCELFVEDNAPALLGGSYTPQIHELRVVCRATVRNLQGDVFSDLDPSDPEAATDIAVYLGALVGAGVLTAAQRDATLGLGKVQRRIFSDGDIDLPALHAAGLITDTEAGLESAQPE